ncbi:hypothetical protein ANO11243_072800 [Dothideomycetidae sp. 11243]|nr:hypothetical protein ANO11243_072800 [fungal sp. No.11243]
MAIHGTSPTTGRTAAPRESGGPLRIFNYAKCDLMHACGESVGSRGCCPRARRLGLRDIALDDFDQYTSLIIVRDAREAVRAQKLQLVPDRSINEWLGCLGVHCAVIVMGLYGLLQRRVQGGEWDRLQSKLELKQVESGQLRQPRACRGKPDRVNLAEWEPGGVGWAILAMLVAAGMHA